MNYADYLAKGNKVNPALLAPLGARPRTSTGDWGKDRFWQDTEKMRALGSKVTNTSNDYVIPKHGYLIRKKGSKRAIRSI